MDYLQCQIDKIEMNELPVTEIFIFFVLGIIVIFRKKWSSNDTYRDKVELNTRKENKKDIMTSFRDISNEQVPKIKDAMEFVADKVSETRRNIKTTILNKMNQVTSTSEKATSLYQYFQSLKGVQNHVFMRMSDDTMFVLLTYISRSELLTLSATCSNLWLYLHSDLVWRHIWMRDYSSMWRHPKIAALRQLRGIRWDPSIGNTYPNTHCSSSTSSVSLSSPSLSSAFASSSYTTTNSVSNSLYTDDSSRVMSSSEPKQGWKYFYLEFQYAWMDWLLAGFTTPEKCIVGIYGRVLDITSFLSEHPGSPESLVDNAGCDATEMFNEIGHSTFARHILPKLIYWEPSNANNGNTNRNDVGTSNMSIIVGSYLGTGSLTPPHHHYASEVVPPPWTLGLERQSIDRITRPVGHTGTDTAQLHPSTFPDGVPTGSRTTTWVKYGSRYVRRLHNYRQILRNSDQNRIILGAANEPMVAGLSGYQQCGVVGSNQSMYIPYISKAVSPNRVEHSGQLRFAFDPVEREWLGWWTCCGKGQLSIAQPPPLEASFS